MQAITKFQLQPIEPGLFVLSCSGGLTWEDRELLAFTVDQHLPRDGQPCHGLVVDFCEVDYVNSAGVGALFQLVRNLRQRGIATRFTRVSARLERLFRAVGLDRSAGVAADLEQAVSALRSAALPGDAGTRN